MTRCKWPSKVKHPSKAAARSAIADLFARNDPSARDMSAYPCGDHWHIGHDWRKFQARIRNSIRSGRSAGTTYQRNRRTKR